jgi:hypothetical protein
MALAAAACAFFDVRRPRPVVAEVSIGDEWRAHVDAPRGDLTVYARWRDLTTGETSEVVVHPERFPVDLVDYGVPPLHQQLGFGPIAVTRDLRTLAEMRALAGVP